MLDCWASTDDDATDLIVVAAGRYASFIAGRPDHERAWLETMRFDPKPGSVALLPSPAGALTGALMIVGDRPDAFDVATARQNLSPGAWRLVDADGALPLAIAAEGWGLAAYRFHGYGAMAKARPKTARLVLDAGDAAARRGVILADAAALGRDMVNRPANDLGPEAMHDVIADLARRFDARFEAIVGDDLLARGFPAIHAVGRAAAQAPRLLDLRWGPADAPRVTLVGKGVCFDTGGLDIKPVNAMALMKKDMGGAATMAALAQAIMASDMKVALRLLVPTVENSISSAAYRPGDVIESRKGLSIEIGNTDAEGRVILSDALTLACEEKPDLLIDAATLTGAARIALGTDVPALFSNDDELARAIEAAGRSVGEPLWRLPLHQPYRKLIESRSADINNAGSKPFGGAITAALFLESFVEGAGAWAHLDIYGYNADARPGRPRGGEATALRPLFKALEDRLATGENV